MGGGDTLRRRFGRGCINGRFESGFYKRIMSGRRLYKVLTPAGDQCSLCRLRHRELLEAAHIIPDSEPGGLPVVTNGISLCTLHHAAFDRNFLGIRPDYVVEIRGDLLEEVDGPMLQHGSQELHGSLILLPVSRAKRPDPELLEERYARFKRAG